LKDGAPAVEGLERRVWTGRDPDDPSRLRAVAIPQEVIDRLIG
jgi:4-hydroxybenzoyl-CoA thioesterase